EHMNRKVKLNQTSIPKTYNKSTSSKIVSFLEFVDKFHTNLILNKDNLTKLFDYPNSKIYTYQEYINSLEISDSTKNSKISIFLEIFSNTLGYESVFTKGKLPNYNTSVSSKRKAIEDEEIIYKIDDIVTNRPPKSNYFNNHKVSTDTSWWKHFDRVVPFEPLIIKLHLRIPTRGASLRLIDRDSLLVIGDRGNIKGFHFVSDKNKKRKEPFIVPNIWNSELSFLINLIEYNKAFFPFLKKHYPDDTTLKNGILPLFPNSDGTGAYTESQHMLYWTKVLIQAQMEFNQENKNKFLIYSKEVDLPKTQEELDNLTIGEITAFRKNYDLHSLRHTGITRNIKAGMPLELVRMLSGHSGFNTILTIYYHINQEELVKNWLNKHNIDITENINMHETSQYFIKKEILRDEIKSKNPEIILEILKNYNFFNPENRNLILKDLIKLEEIAKSEPISWKPLRTGICTKAQCPLEIIGRCSLCPYFITNYMFIHEIGLELQLSIARVKKYSEMVIKNRENGDNKNNLKLRQQMNNEIEDFTGWLEILSLANSSYKDSQYDFNNQEKGSLINEPKLDDYIFNTGQSLSIEHGYLEILVETYKRKIFDNETVLDITNIMANKIIKYTIKNNSYKEIEDLNNEEIIKWFLPTYERISKNLYSDKNSIEELVNLLKSIGSNEIKLEYKNENPFLAK
ncbi:MAG: tyrosine-type recombinase/integrase, partial [Fusobacteriaceae bacterium]|nr:tyrosine-type recombinase/integrase [Fusobacteriaceae bacterium]